MSQSSEGPVLKDAPSNAPRPVEPIGDHDTSILSHLGMPFYYRHSPTRAATRGTIWITFLILLAIVVLNVIQMPYNKDTYVYAIRATFFSSHPAYQTAEEGACSICYQLFSISIILSGIVAPLFGTYSFSSERVLGTLEFLRLSPMSTLSVIMGKMFAPTFVLHLISFSMLLLGLAFGLCGGLAAGKLFLAMICILSTSAIFHGLGALLGVMTVAFRGFFAVGLLLGLGFIISVAPMSTGYDKAIKFLAFMSPWGAMDTLFWRSYSRYGGTASGEAIFMGSEALVLPIVVLTHALFFGLLVWAACRKFDRPERPALPFAAWIVLWAYWGALCLGLLPNFEEHRYLQWNPNYAWQIAGALFPLGAFVVCVLAMLDHPHERENVLTEECEFAAGREDAPGASARRLKHALFVAVLVCVSTTVMSWMIINGQQKSVNASFTRDTAIAIVGIATTLAFLFSVVLECCWVKFSSFWVRWASFVGFAIFLAAVFISLGTVNAAYYRWERTVTGVIEVYSLQSSGAQRVRRSLPDMNWVRANPDYAIYLPGTETLEGALKLQDEYRGNLPAFYWNYHRAPCLAFPALFVALAVLLLLGRRSTYAALRKEAIRAVKGSPPPMASASASASAPLAQQEISAPPAAV